MPWRQVFTACVHLLLLWVFAVSVVSAGAREISAEQIQIVFPVEGGHAAALQTSGRPAAARVVVQGELRGYVFSTFDITGSLGYSGKPVDILVGLTTDGLITGAHLFRHEEPILIIGVAPEDLETFVAGFAGFNISDAVSATARDLPPVVSGASVSSGVIADAIVRSARAVANAYGLAGEDPQTARLDRSSFEPATWQDLLSDGTLAQLTLRRGAVDQALGIESDEETASRLFIDLYAALITPPRAGQNLLGRRAFERIVSRAGARDNAILLAANGLYSFKGTGYVRSGVFDRIQIVQGSRTIRLVRDGYTNLARIAADGAPEMRETGVFTLPADTGFDPLEPWRLELFVTGETAEGGVLGSMFPIHYVLPLRYRLGETRESAVSVAPEAKPLWRQTWENRTYEIAGLVIWLTVFAGVLILQDAVVRNDRFYRWSRIAFLTVTLVWLGWIAGAQLSVVNIITFSQALLSGFEWELFLLDPLVFLLWGFVAVALLFWGRGVYCGWLCPFGALQELVNQVARWFRIPQFTVPFVLHERLWPIKYILFLGLFAVSLGSIELAFRGAEVEPFKTAISLKFMREWPYVLYAVVLLGAGLFIERFYCRYLCPLGAALAIPARLRMFDWLRRRAQCGLECKICATNCTVQAIHPNGEINPNECIHCLNCQRFYYDKTNCPPLIVKEKRRQHREAVARKAAAEEKSKS